MTILSSTTKKTAALASSLLLVAGCVSMRAGFFDGVGEPKTNQSGEKDNEPKTGSLPKTPTDDSSAEPAIFYGTKAPLSVAPRKSSSSNPFLP